MHAHTHTPRLSYSNDKRQKTKDKEEILKKAREGEKNHLLSTETRTGIIVDFS